MSNARPMSSDRRHTAYGTRPTARQRHQWYRMDMRRRYRDAGTLAPSGASGLPVPRPARHHSWPPERGFDRHPHRRPLCTVRPAPQTAHTPVSEERDVSFPHYSVDCDRYHDVVRDFGGDPPRPTITVLCGSTRFHEQFREHNLRLTVDGHIVLSIGCDTRSDGDLLSTLVDDVEALKTRLDELHKRKIDLADEVLVLNVGGYIGESTRSEIEYAEKVGRPVRYLEPLS